MVLPAASCLVPYHWCFIIEYKDSNKEEDENPIQHMKKSKYPTFEGKSGTLVGDIMAVAIGCDLWLQLIPDEGPSKVMRHL